MRAGAGPALEGQGVRWILRRTFHRFTPSRVAGTAVFRAEELVQQLVDPQQSLPRERDAVLAQRQVPVGGMLPSGSAKRVKMSTPNLPWK